MTINNKEIKHTIELCGTSFLLHYFKPSSFKNMSADIVSEIKLLVHVLSSIYGDCSNSHYFPDPMSVDYVKEKTQEILELSRRSGYRVLVLNAPFNAIGVFVFGRRFSMINNIFGGQSDGFYSILFTNIQNLVMECEQKMMGENGRTK